MDIEIVCKTSGIFGNIKRLYRIAEYLRNAGHNVVINMSDGSRNTWFEHNVPENQTIKPAIRICPETYQKPLIDGRNILYVQAQFDLPENQYDAIVTTSQFLKTHLEQNDYKVDYKIPYGFDSVLFIPDDARRIVGRVGYMPRKGKQELDLILDSKIDFLKIDNLSERETIQALQTCDIFLATSRTEGFGLPPFEAALCGCLIIGYHGKGGREWLNRDTFVPCDFPQEFLLQIEGATKQQFESQRRALRNLILKDLTINREAEAWLQVIENLRV